MCVLPLRLAGFVFVVAIVAAAACGVIYVRLSHGPVSLKFLAPSIEKGINAELPGLHARIEDALIAVTDGGTVELRLTNLQISEQDGDTVAVVPTAAVELSRPALWSMKMVPARIDLINARLSLVYSKDSGLTLSFGRDGMDRTLPSDDGAPRLRPGVPPESTAGNADHGKVRGVNLAAVITEATAQARKRLDVSSYLNQVGVRDAVVSLDNLGVHSEWRLLEGLLEVDRLSPRMVVSGTASIASERGPWTVSLRSEEGGHGASAGFVGDGWQPLSAYARACRTAVEFA